MNQDIQGKICYLQDEDGNSHFPITSVEAVIGPDYNLKTKLSELSKKINDIQSSQGSQDGEVAGENGATFTPNVSEEGVLTWTNDKGLENPMVVNIKGPKGEPGTTSWNDLEDKPDVDALTLLVEEITTQLEELRARVEELETINALLS